MRKLFAHLIFVLPKALVKADGGVRNDCKYFSKLREAANTQTCGKPYSPTLASFISGLPKVGAKNRFSWNLAQPTPLMLPCVSPSSRRTQRRTHRARKNQFPTR